MKFGIFDHLDDNGAGPGKLFDDRLRIAEAYDQAGFYAYHLAEHHSTPLGLAGSPGIFLSSVAQRTKQLRFGPLVYLLPFYHPIRLLEEICMLDQLSHGRFQLGIGRGISPVEAGFYGIDWTKAAQMYDEALAIILQGMNAKELTYEGKYYTFKNVPLSLSPAQQPRPPLWYGLIHPETTVWAAAHAVNVVTLTLAPQARAIVERYREEWARIGNTPETLPLIGMSRHLVVGETDESALASARRAYPRWRESFHYLWRRYAPEAARSPIAALYPETFDELQAMGNGFAGSPQSVKRFVAEELEVSGVNYMAFWMAFGDLTLDESLRSVALFRDEVMPVFPDRKLAPARA